LCSWFFIDFALRGTYQWSAAVESNGYQQQQQYLYDSAHQAYQYQPGSNDNAGTDTNIARQYDYHGPSSYGMAGAYDEPSRRASRLHLLSEVGDGLHLWCAFPLLMSGPGYPRCLASVFEWCLGQFECFLAIR
jgi:hypothetical protein